MKKSAVALALFLYTAAASGQALTTRVSVDSAGTEANGFSSHSAASFDADVVAFESVATNLIPNDFNGMTDIFVHYRATGVTERVSVGHLGQEGNYWSQAPAISEDGKVVAFQSAAFNLVPNDFNGDWDILVRDLKTGTTEVVSITPSGFTGNGPSLMPSLSRDGRYVAFTSAASNLVPNDGNAAEDVFVYDRATKTLECITLDANGYTANAVSYWATISSGGQFVAFYSLADNLGPADTNGKYDIYIRDRLTGTTELVSVDSNGVQANGNSNAKPAMDRSGRFVAFQSFADNLVPNDTNMTGDIFVRDRQNGTTERVSVGSGGIQSNHYSYLPTISTFGRYVGFTSFASNLVPGDTNLFSDVFVYDRVSHVTRRVSLTSSNKEAKKGGEWGFLCASAAYVTFESDSTDHVTSDLNGTRDVFARTTDLRDSRPLP